MSTFQHNTYLINRYSIKLSYIWITADQYQCAIVHNIVAQYTLIPVLGVLKPASISCHFYFSFAYLRVTDCLTPIVTVGLLASLKQWGGFPLKYYFTGGRCGVQPQNMLNVHIRNTFFELESSVIYPLICFNSSTRMRKTPVAWCH